MQFRKIAVDREWNFGRGLSERLFQKTMVPESCSSSDVLSVAPDGLCAFFFFSFFFSLCATAQSKSTGAVFRQHHLPSLLQRRSPTATDETLSKTATSEQDDLRALIAPTPQPYHRAPKRFPIDLSHLQGSYSSQQVGDQTRVRFTQEQPKHHMDRSQPKPSSRNSPTRGKVPEVYWADDDQEDERGNAEDSQYTFFREGSPTPPEYEKGLAAERAAAGGSVTGSYAASRSTVGGSLPPAEEYRGCLGKYQQRWGIRRGVLWAIIIAVMLLVIVLPLSVGLGVGLSRSSKSSSSSTAPGPSRYGIAFSSFRTYISC